jgi:hypothetical protein
MSLDDEIEFDDGFWVTQTGCVARYSDGAPGEEAKLATMLHTCGWVDVAVEDRRVVVRLNPATAGDAVLDGLWEALDERAAARRIELILVDPDAAPVSIAFLDTSDACRHLERVTRGSPDDGRDSAWGDEAFPVPAPHDLGGFNRYPFLTPMTTTPLGNPFKDLSTVEPERFARAMATSEWLATPNTDGILRDGRLINSEPEMVTFAMRTFGWAAIKRKWSLHHLPLSACLPEVVAIDPGAIGREVLSHLLALCGAWERFGDTMTIAWWNGKAWVLDVGYPRQVAERLRTVCRAAANDEARSTFSSVELPLDRLNGVQSTWSNDHPFVIALRRWRDERTGAGSSEAVLQDLERQGLFNQRTKLVKVDNDNEDMHILRYAPGTVTLWDERAHSAMVGCRLVDVPDPALGMSVHRDLLAVYRRGEPIFHQCQGILSGSGGLQLSEWSRLTLPLYREDQNGRREVTLLSTCDLTCSVLL